MKKIILCITILLCISGCKGNEQVNSGNNQQGETKPELSMKEELGGQTILCEDMKEKTIKWIDYNGIVLDNTVYSKTDSLYSNNQNCLAKENFDNFIIGYPELIFVKNNKIMTWSGNNFLEKDFGYIEPNPLYKQADIISLYFENITTETYDSSNTPKSGKEMYLALNKDGNVYRYIVQWNYNYTKRTKKILSKEIVYNKNDYGNIKYFCYEEHAQKKEQSNVVILSDKGLFNNQKIETEECLKYEDIECKYEIKFNEKYDKYKNDIIYFNRYFFVDKDYNIYSTESIVSIPRMM